MLDVKQAVKTATTAVLNFYDTEELKELLLEEVEFDEDNQQWKITLGFYVPNKNPPKNELFALAAAADERKYDRKYKIFAIDAESGNVISMKIREL